MKDNNAKTRGWAILLPFAASLFTLPGLTGCETTTHAQQGEVVGGVLGGVLGSQVGEGSGQTAEALNNNRTGQPTTWTNPDTGEEYTVKPTRTFEESGGPCREFELDATVGGEPDQTVNGTACLQADGSWKIQS